MAPGARGAPASLNGSCSITESPGPPSTGKWGPQASKSAASCISSVPDGPSKPRWALKEGRGAPCFSLLQPQGFCTSALRRDRVSWCWDRLSRPPGLGLRKERPEALKGATRGPLLLGGGRLSCCSSNCCCCCCEAAAAAVPGVRPFPWGLLRGREDTERQQQKAETASAHNALGLIVLPPSPPQQGPHPRPLGPCLYI